MSKIKPETFMSDVMSVLSTFDVRTAGPIQTEQAKNCLYIAALIESTWPIMDKLIQALRGSGFNAGYLYYVQIGEYGEGTIYRYTVAICEPPLNYTDFKVN